MLINFITKFTNVEVLCTNTIMTLMIHECTTDNGARHFVTILYHGSSVFSDTQYDTLVQQRSDEREEYMRLHVMSAATRPQVEGQVTHHFVLP